MSEAGHVGSSLDSIVIRPVRVPILLGLLVGMAISFSPLLGMPLLVVGTVVAICWSISMLVRMAFAARKHLWKTALSLLAIVLIGWPALMALLVAGDYIHLAII